MWIGMILIITIPPQALTRKDLIAARSGRFGAVDGAATPKMQGRQVEGDSRQPPNTTTLVSGLFYQFCH